MEHRHLCVQQVSIQQSTIKEKFESSVCVTHAQYFGKPILCDAGHASSGIDEEVLSKRWLFFYNEI